MGHPITQSLIAAAGECPDFAALLRNPISKAKLPSDFRIEVEARHLRNLWEQNPGFHPYSFDAFVSAGGSGMVFKVLPPSSRVPVALKVVRSKVYHAISPKPGVATNLSPVSETELRALEQISHPNVVRLSDSIADKKGIIAIATTYVESPENLDDYLNNVLQKEPSRGRGKIRPFSPQRLDNACRFLVEKCTEIASALDHMHSLNIFHFDIKPANVLISSDGPLRQTMLTDMGACVHASDLATGAKLRVHFTWTYAHPDLQDIVHDPGSVSGGGLKSSASIEASDRLSRYDLFALGKTIQELLAILQAEFGERCNASYGFRFLHIVACLLLDGKNVPAPADKSGAKITVKDGRRFVYDTALDYRTNVFEVSKITSTGELLARLARFRNTFSASELAPELSAWQPDLINAVAHSPAPFTERVAAIFNHPCMRRLKDQPQLGWMREVYPGATHDRWSHSLGAFSATVGYYNALLADAELPTLRLFAKPIDLSHAFVAAIIHDLGQTTFGHDFEEACDFLFSHEMVVEQLLGEKCWGESLAQTIKQHWPEVDLKRALAIVRKSPPTPGQNIEPAVHFIDGIATDVIRGPIDADKLDYLLRDSIFCGVPYGRGIDVERFLRAMTVTSSTDSMGPRLRLAYKAKGRGAVASLLLARYQMFAAVYWHHTFRCIQGMFVHAAAATFTPLKHFDAQLRNLRVSRQGIRSLFYERVICGKPWSESRMEGKKLPRVFYEESSGPVESEPSLDFVWRFAADPHRRLLERLATRQLYKRIFEMRLGELGERADYSAMKAALAPELRAIKTKQLKDHFVNAILNAMRERGPGAESVTENAARRRVQEIKSSDEPLVVLDFPVRGVPDDFNTPQEIGDAMRKYFVMPTRGAANDDNVFYAARRLQEHLATIRIYTAPELHELVIRYLDSRAVQGIVESVIPVGSE